METQEDLLSEAVQEVNDMVEASISHQMSVGELVNQVFRTSSSISAGSGTITTSGYLGVNQTSGTTYYTIPSQPSHNLIDYTTQLKTLQDLLKDANQTPKSIIDNIEQMIATLNRTASDDLEDYQNKAIKHLTYAKAYLDKMLLDTLNQNL